MARIAAHLSLDSVRSSPIRALLLAIVAAAFVLSGSQANTSRAASDQPFLAPHSLVEIADRPVCSLLGADKIAVGITGQDSGGMVEVNGVTYWTFGDTLLAGGGLLPNILASSTDNDASDCLTLVPNTKAGLPVPLLVRTGSESAVWPIGMEATGPNTVHFFYDSVVPNPPGWKILGVGLASFDTQSLTADRALGGALLWRQETGLLARNARTYADGEYVYVFLTTGDNPMLTDTILVRVRKESIEDLNAYEYWQPAQASVQGHWIGGLWNEQEGVWDPAVASIRPLWSQAGGHNGVEVAYNDFLGRWLAVYTTNVMTSLKARTAQDITGPWDETETELVHCPDFHPPPNRRYICYSGAQQEYYSRDGGRTIYVTYSNSDAYSSFLHEIRLGAPVYQWTGPSGTADYRAGDEQPTDELSQNGIVFYASDIPVPGFAAIHRWQNTETGGLRFAAASPQDSGSYSDAGVAFYAPLDQQAAAATNALYAPVYRWSNGSEDRYSALNLGPAGFTAQERVFYAACPDSDMNRVTDCEESFTVGDNPNDDPDHDGMSTLYEQATPGCDPVIYNDDQDGLSTSSEMASGTTNPCVWDSGYWGCANAPVRDPGCDKDTDGDRCMDAWELGPDPRYGGQRDPTNPWDYLNPTGDGQNRIDDVVAVVSRYFANSGQPRYLLAADRSNPVGPQPWDLGPPDGHIRMDDIMGAIRSYLHDCR